MVTKAVKDDKYIDPEQNLLPICKHCYEKNLIVKVHKMRGTKYYYCKNCQKYLWGVIKINEKGEMVEFFCPSCPQERLIRKGTSHGKKKVYFCHNCEEHTVDPTIVTKVLQELQEVFCGKCKGDNLVKRGFDVSGKQIYHCGDCEKRTIKVVISLSTTFISKKCA